MRETEFWAFFGNFHVLLFFHAHFFLRLIIEFYEKMCHFFEFLLIFTHIFSFHASKTIFFHAKEPIFHVEKKTLGSLTAILGLSRLPGEGVF